MTENEAIKEIKCWLNVYAGSRIAPEMVQATGMAIKALEEVQQYREIGTPEECRAAVEKQTAKKDITYRGTNRADCPACGATVRGIDAPFGNWCSKCGQRLDWEDEE